MSGTRTLHAVVGYALRCGADVRLVGDDKQLGAVMIPISPEAAGMAVTGLLNLSKILLYMLAKERGATSDTKLQQHLARALASAPRVVAAETVLTPTSRSWMLTLEPPGSCPRNCHTVGP
jgi:hypothetical protein